MVIITNSAVIRAAQAHVDHLAKSTSPRLFGKRVRMVYRLSWFKIRIEFEDGTQTNVAGDAAVNILKAVARDA